MLLNLGLSLGVTALLVVVVEGGARLIERRRPPSEPVADYIWDWDAKMPGGFYVMKSDAAGWPPWEEFNADGLRDRTRPHEKPDGVRRVVVLGDSVTLGAQIRRDQAFPQLLEARLGAAGRPIEVMNVALWGWSTRQERIAWSGSRAVPAGRRDPGRLPQRHPGAVQQPRTSATLAQRPCTIAPPSCG